MTGTAGDPNNSATWDLGVAAFLPTDGATDTTFGTNGTATADFGPADRGRGIAIQSDGKIVVSGFTGSGDGNLVLARFLPPSTKINSFTGSSSIADHSVTLTASNILNSNPTSPISQVYCYLQNPDLSLTLLGTGANNNGVWTFTFSEASFGLTSGSTYTFVGQAADSNGVLSDPVTVSLQVL